MKKIAIALLFAGVSLMAADGAELFKKCIACHGIKAEKQALGKSRVIAGWEAAKIEEALTGYKAGTRNEHGMGVVMTGQVGKFSAEEIKAVAEHVSTLK